MVDFRVSGEASIDPDRIIEDVDMILEKLDELRDKVDEIDLELDRLANKGVDIEVNIRGEDKLIFLRDLIEEIDSRIYFVDIEVNIKDEYKLDELKLKADEMDAKRHQFNMDININGAAKATTELVALDKELNNKEKDMKNASKATEGFQFSMLSLLPLLTAIIPIAASAGAGIIGLAGAFAVMAPAILGIALAAKPAFTEIQNLTKSLDQNTQNAIANAKSYDQIYNILEKNSKQFQQMSGDLQGVTVGWFQLKNAYTAFQKAVDPAVFPMLEQGMDLLRTLLSGLPALVRPAAAALQNWLQDFSTRLKDPTFKAFFSDMKNNMYTLVSDWATGILNIIEGLAGLFHAFMPITMDISGGFLRMTQSFDQWASKLAQSKGFQQFVDYVKTNGPIVLHVIGQLVELIGRIAAALSGMGAGSLGIIDKIVTGLNHFAQTNPGLFKVAANLLIVGIAVAKLAPLLAPLIEFLATPVGAIVGVIVALAAGFVFLYEKSKQFHDFVNKQLGPMWNGLIQQGKQFAAWAKGLWPEIKQVWDKYGKEIEAIIKDDFGFIISVIEGAMKIIKGIIDVALGLLTGKWSQVWKGLGEIVSGIWKIIVGLVENGIKLVIDHFKMFNTFIMGLAQDGANALRRIWDQGMSTLERRIKEGWDAIIAGAKQWGSDIYHTVLGGWANVGNFFDSIPAKVGAAFANAGSWLIQAGKSIIDGLVNGIKDAAGSALKGVLSWVTSLIPSWKGPADKDRTLLYDSGALIMKGLNNGIMSGVSDLQKNLGSITKTIDNTFGKQYTTDISTRINAAISDANFAVNSFNAGGSLPSAQPNQVTFAAGAIQVYNAKPEQPGITLTRVLTGAARMGTIQAPVGYTTQTG